MESEDYKQLCYASIKDTPTYKIAQELFKTKSTITECIGTLTATLERFKTLTSNSDPIQLGNSILNRRFDQGTLPKSMGNILPLYCT